MTMCAKHALVGGTVGIVISLSAVPLLAQTDDHGDSPDLATVVIPDLPGAPGEIEVTDDEDWFSFDAAIGNAYDISAAPGTIGSARVYVYDTDGETLLTHDSGELLWFAPSSDTYYIRVTGATFTETGTYTLSVATHIDDHGNTEETATAIAVGAPAIAGEIEILEDRDFFSFTAVEATIYAIHCEPGSASPDVRLYSPGYSPLTDDWCEVTWSVPEGAGGTLYFEVRARSSSFLGTYACAVEILSDDHGSSAELATAVTVGDAPVSGVLDVPGDQDWFSFTPEEGVEYVIQAESDGPHDLQVYVEDNEGNEVKSGSTTLRLSPVQHPGERHNVRLTGPSCQTDFEVQAYQFSVEVYDPDDEGKDPASATPLTVDDDPPGSFGPWPFTFDFEGDEDWFSFPALAGEDYCRRYIPAFIPGGGNGVGEGHPVIEMYDKDGISPIDSPLGGSSWRCPAHEDGTHFLKVYPTGTLLEDYAILVSTYDDDHGMLPETTTPLSPDDAPVTGNIELDCDEDGFRFQAEAGIHYRFRLVADESVRVRLDLRDVTGGAIGAANEWESLAMSWTCPEGGGGTYYAVVGGPSACGYTLSMEVIDDSADGGPDTEEDGGIGDSDDSDTGFPSDTATATPTVPCCGTDTHKESDTVVHPESETDNATGLGEATEDAIATDPPPDDAVPDTEGDTSVDMPSSQDTEQYDGGEAASENKTKKGCGCSVPGRGGGVALLFTTLLRVLLM